jgi:hypothetical protein
MSIAGELESKLAAAIASTHILLPSASMCKYILHATGSRKRFSVVRGVLKYAEGVG